MVAWGLGPFCGCCPQLQQACRCHGAVALPETGIAPLVVTVATKAVSVAAAVGRYLAWDAAVDWVLDAFGATDLEVASSGVFEPLTSNARAYYLSHDLKNWETSARAQFTGAAQASALATIERSRQVVRDAAATLLDVKVVAEQISGHFDELHRQPSVFGGHDGAADQHWWEAATDAVAPSTLPATPSVPEPAGGSVGPGAHVASARVQSASSTSTGLWVGLGVGLGLMGLFAWSQSRGRRY